MCRKAQQDTIFPEIYARASACASVIPPFFLLLRHAPLRFFVSDLEGDAVKPFSGVCLGSAQSRGVIKTGFARGFPHACREGHCESVPEPGHACARTL